MAAVLDARTMDSQDQELDRTLRREAPRLRGYIRARVADDLEAEDILEEVFEELLTATRLLRPIERVSAWLYRVAQNRIIDSFRRRRPVSLQAPAGDGAGALEDLLPSPEAGPETAIARAVLSEELASALGELPAEQRDAFLANEVDGKSFRELSAETGVPLNTLLSRKHRAVLHLRERLREIRDDYS